MWRPVSSDGGRLAVLLKSLKRRSSLRLRARLRSGAGLASFGFWFGLGCLFAPSLLASPVPDVCLSSNVSVTDPASIVINTSKLVGFGCILVLADSESWLGD